MKNDTVKPVLKSLSRLVTTDELTKVSGAGTVVKLPGAVTTENSYDKNGKYVSQDKIESN